MAKQQQIGPNSMVTIISIKSQLLQWLSLVHLYTIPVKSNSSVIELIIYSHVLASSFPQN